MLWLEEIVCYLVFGCLMSLNQSDFLATGTCTWSYELVPHVSTFKLRMRVWQEWYYVRVAVSEIGFCVSLKVLLTNCPSFTQELGNIYHCEEDAKLMVHIDKVSISESELRFLFFLACQSDGYLLGGHWKNWKLDTIEFIEAAPSTRLGETLVYSSETTVVHLVGTVEDDYIFAEAASHVLHRLRLACSSGACRCPSEGHTQGLRQRNIAPVKQDKYLTPSLFGAMLRSQWILSVNAEHYRVSFAIFM